MIDFPVRIGFTGAICVGVENKLDNLRPIAPCRSRVQCSRTGWLCWTLYQRKRRATWGKSNTKMEGRKFCILSAGYRKKTNEKALLDSIVLNQKSWTKNPALPHPRPTSCSCCLSAVLLEETGGGNGSWLTSLNHCYFNWTLIPPQHVWQHSMHPPPPMPSSFSLLAKQGDFFYWYGDAADWIQLFVLISLLYFREVEGLALQSQLHYKADKKFTVQVTSKKECTPFIAQCCTWTRSWEIIRRFGILVSQS